MPSQFIVAEARRDLRHGLVDDATGKLLRAQAHLRNPDQALHTDLHLLTACAFAAHPEASSTDLQRHVDQYARVVSSAAFSAGSEQHHANLEALRLLIALRQWTEGQPTIKQARIHAQMRETLTQLIALRGESAPLLLFALIPYDTDRQAALERTWQAQEIARTLGRATFEGYRRALLPSYAVLQTANVNIDLIGTPHVTINGQALSLSGTDVLLLAYLALHRAHPDTAGLYSRRDLADVFTSGSDVAINQQIRRLYRRLRDHGVSEDLIGQRQGDQRKIQHTVRHHRVSIDLEDHAARGAAHLRRALGPGGVQSLLTGIDHPWADTLRDTWALTLQGD